jgi:ABC-type multidrug transport system ATPase subunit
MSKGQRMNLRYEGLRRTYGAKIALQLGHGQIDDGRITGIFGPAGAGKSAFLDIIAGLDRPSDGRMMYGYIGADGHQRFCENAPRTKMALPFRQPWRTAATVERAIARALGGKGLSREEAAARIGMLMAALELGPLAKHRSWQLTEDERQRAAFARLLSPCPELLVMDEPPLTLDAGTLASMDALVKAESAERGMTVVVASSDPARIRHLADELIIMGHGRIIERGAPEDLLPK